MNDGCWDSDCLVPIEAYDRDSFTNQQPIYAILTIPPPILRLLLHFPLPDVQFLDAPGPLSNNPAHSGKLTSILKRPSITRGITTK